MNRRLTDPPGRGVVPTHERCTRCGYDLYAQPRTAACPECGRRVVASLENHRAHPRPSLTVLLLLVLDALWLWWGLLLSGAEASAAGRYQDDLAAAALIAWALGAAAAWGMLEPVGPDRRRGRWEVALLASLPLLPAVGAWWLGSERGLFAVGWVVLAQALAALWAGLVRWNMPLSAGLVAAAAGLSLLLLGNFGHWPLRVELPWQLLCVAGWALLASALAPLTLAWSRL